MAIAEFSKFAGILSEALSQYHLLGFEIAQLFSNKQFLTGKSQLQKFSLCKKFHPMLRYNLGKTLRFLSTNPSISIRRNVNGIQGHKHVSVS